MAKMLKEIIEEVLVSPLSKKGKLESIREKGMYEVWFTIIHDRKTGAAYWLRVTILVPMKVNQENQEKEKLILWFGMFSTKSSSKHVMVKRAFDLAEFKFGNKEAIVSSNIGSMGVSYSRFNFMLSDGSQYGWDLKYSSFKEPYHHVPSIAKSLGIITTIPVTAHPNIQITGSLTINGETHLLEEAVGTQTHIIGKTYGNEWAWAHCNTFKGLKDAYLELSSTAGRCTFGFHDGTKSYLFNTPLELFRTSTNYTTTSLEFSGENLQYLVKGKIEVPIEDLIAIEYLGPHSERIICYNSELANCTIKIYEKSSKKRNDEPIFKAESKRGCAFETTRFVPLEDGPRILKWEEEKLKK